MALTKAPEELLDKSLTSALTVTVDDNSDTLTIVSTDADDAFGPFLNLHRNSSSPADNDGTGVITFAGENDNNEEIDYAQIQTAATDVSDGSEDGTLAIQTMVAGTSRDRITFSPSETSLNENSVDVDFRVESDSNANAIFVNAGDDRVTFFNSTTVNTASGTTDGFSHYSDGRTDISRASAQPLNIRRRTDDGAIINFYKEASGSVTNIGAVGTLTGDLVIHSNTADHVGLRFGNTRLQPTDNTGATSDGASDLGFSNSRFKDCYISGGIHLGGTGSDNKLDDYEEGTWTATVNYGTSSGTAATLANNGGTYTKVGRLVTAHAFVNVSNTNSGSGNVYVGGLPFTVADLLASTGVEASGIISYYTAFSSAVNSLRPRAENSTKFMTIDCNTSATQTAATTLTAAIMGTGEIRLTITYFAA